MKKAIVVQSRVVADTSVEIVVSLKNFISYAGISAVLTNGMETIDLPYQRVKKKLTISIPISRLSDDVNNYILLSNAKQKFWLKLDEHIEEVFYHVAGNKLFRLSVNKKVLVKNLLPNKPAQGFFNYEDTIKVFLQHEVLGRKPVEYDRKNYELPFDLFIVSSDSEKYDVVMNKMGYNEEEVAATGLARFDNLPKGNNSKDILLMPTWREWIHTDEQFLKSQYYNYYNNLINNERL
ncbi:hypothetical protein [Oceanobacillus sojae]|uniref:Uncharacterized protein n=1 Tax=Oceanobacillus sojae TaxID=582851 RepID=A0A511ZQK1_9BACI|nr:hypothetical protein [Oceanobacillus sojae]GEN89736.1 hypothetical protein OSO01_44750 [Oceanobacillus sojae]